MAKVLTPRSKVITGATPTELSTNVDTQVATLANLYVNPAQNQDGSTAATGTVENGSIVIVPLNTQLTTQNVPTYQAAVNWNEFRTI